MPVLGDLFLSARLFWLIGGVVVLAAVSYVVPVLFPVVQVLSVLVAVALLVDLGLLFFGGRLVPTREVSARLSNGDDNPVGIAISSTYRFPIQVLVIDEAPVEFQLRDLRFEGRVPGAGRERFSYDLRPTRRGVYSFGRVLAYATSPLGLAVRRFRGDGGMEAKVYPAFLQMKRWLLMATSNRLEEVGVRRIRRVGRTMEFDQIREYVPGDDPRTVNWQATARRSSVMVNQYQEERSQPIYALLEMGRTMRPAFDGLTLLDHAINASLVLLNVAILRGDRAGLVAFSEEVDLIIPAERRPTQRLHLLEALHRQETRFGEPNYEALVAKVRRHVSRRALLVLFANFETVEGLQRQLPLLRMLARAHLVLVVCFENVGLDELQRSRATTVQDVYVKAVAEKMTAEKHEIVRELNRHGVLSLLTRPERLTADLINQYLKIKAEGRL